MRGDQLQLQAPWTEGPYLDGSQQHFLQAFQPRIQHMTHYASKVLASAPERLLRFSSLCSQLAMHGVQFKRTRSLLVDQYSLQKYCLHCNRNQERLGPHRVQSAAQLLCIKLWKAMVWLVPTKSAN